MKTNAQRYILHNIKKKSIQSRISKFTYWFILLLSPWIWIEIVNFQKAVRKTVLISTPILASSQPKLDLGNLKYLRSEGLPSILLRQQDEEGGQSSESWLQITRAARKNRRKDMNSLTNNSWSRHLPVNWDGNFREGLKNVEEKEQLIWNTKLKGMADAWF